MATKKRTKILAPSRDDKERPASETDVDAPGELNVDTDVERIDSGAAPEIGSVEALDPATPRVDIEHGGDTDKGDVERRPV